VKKSFCDSTSILVTAGIFAFVVLWAGMANLHGGVVDQILDADYEALEQPLVPGMGNYEPAKISSKLGYVWCLPDKTQAMVLLGDFTLKMPHQTLTSRDAVVWLKVVDRDGQRVKQLDVFMEGGAKISEVSGSVTTDEILSVTVFTSGQVEVDGDSIAYRDGSGQEIFHRAELLWTRASVEAGEGDRIVVHGRAKKEKELQERRPIAIRGNFTVGPKLAGQPVLMGTEGIYLLQAASPGGEAMEIRATNAILFLKPEAVKVDKQVKPKGKKRKSLTSKPARELTAAEAEKRLQELPTEEEAAKKKTPAEQVRSNRYISAAYLEGDVVIVRGYRQIRADQVYYDFEGSKALICNAVARTLSVARDVPVYVRAAEVRQLSETQYMATDAKITTSEFYTPSYHIGATKVYFEDRTEKLASGEQLGLVAGQYKVYNSTLNVEGVPLLYWPYSQGDFKQSETSIKSLTFSYDNDKGISGKTRWYLLPLLGLQEPEGVDATLKLDYYGKHGPGVGIDAEYERETYYGMVRSFYIYDTGEDHLGGQRGDVEPPFNDRGRFLIRHRQYLPQGWELTLELSYLSDLNFLEEYFRREFETGKEQETLLYLKKVFGDMVFSVLGKWRINNFLTQTEKLPDVAFDVLGKQVGDSVVTWFSENHVGAVRRLTASDNPWWYYWKDPNLQETDVVARADTRQEVDVPLTLGKLNLVPWGMVRGTAWDDSYDGGGLQRAYGQTGVRGSLYQSKVYDEIDSRFWDLHRIKHIMKETFAIWGSATNVDSSQLTPFDEGIETIDQVDGFSGNWRNRFQTKRGGPGNWRTVDWLTLDLGAGFFNDSEQTDNRNRTRGQTYSFRPENSITSNYASFRSNYRISDSTSVLYDMIVDTDHCRMGTSGLGLFFERSPRFNCYIGHRYIGLTDSNLLAFGSTYQLNSKYSVAMEEQFDLEAGKNSDLEVSLVRKMPRWNFALTAGFDKTSDVNSVSLSLWPEGIPQWTLGSRKFARMTKFMPTD
jgi:hypothetical protein